MRRRLAFLAATALAAVPVSAQEATRITPDVAADRSLGTSVASTGNIHVIDGGTLSGGNLFHSFSHFDLAAGETARWVRSGGDASAVAHVINRVTGGEPSLIGGTLDSSALPNADFWFINPAGIVFGDGARLNVPAAAHFSAAQALHFADNQAFTIATPGGSTFSMAPPEAFGFVGGAGDILVGPVGGDFARAAADLSFSAANVRFSGALILAGSFSVAAVGDAAASFAPDSAPERGFSGEIVLEDGTSLVASGSRGIALASGRFAMTGSELVHDNGDPLGAPEIRIRADTVDLRTSTILAAGFADAPSAAVDMSAATIDLADSAIVAAPTGAGASGAIRLAADRLTMSASVIAADSFGEAPGGEISIEAGEMEMRAASAIFADTFGTGPGGLIMIRADRLSMDESDISSAALSGSGGDAGGIMIEAGALELTGGSRILSDTRSSGNAGLILIDGGNVRIDERSQIATLAAEEASGRAGVIFLSADNLAVADGASVSSDTEGAGDAGGVIIRAGQVEVSGGGRISSESRACQSQACGGGGAAGGVAITADRLRVVGRSDADTLSAISTDARADGGGGAIALEVGSLEIADGGNVSADNFGSGPGGEIDIEAGSIVIRNAQLSSGAFGSGSGGAIEIEAGSIRLEQSGLILARSSFQESGPGGSILIRADDLTLVDESEITSSTFGGGNAGAIDIVARRILAEGFSSISSDSFGAGDGGSISLAADELRLLGSFVFAEALGFCDGGCRPGDAGDISIDARNLILTGQVDPFGTTFARISSSTGTEGAAGDIVVRSERVQLDGGAISSETNGAGNAGTIEMATGDLSLRGESRISTSSTFFCTEACGPSGAGGAVRIVASGTIDIDGNSEISSNTTGSGDAGEIEIAARRLRMGEGRIETLADLGASGDAGSLAIRAQDFAMEGFATLSSRSDGSGAAGRIGVEADTILVDRRSSILSSAGIDASAAGTIELTGRDIRIDNFSFVSSSTFGAAGGGDVRIMAERLVAGDFSEILSSTFGSGDGGEVFIQANEIDLSMGVDIASRAAEGSTGNAGVVAVAADRLNVRSAAAISSSTLGIGDAGLVVIDAGLVRLDQGIVSSGSESETAGASGEIVINADTLEIADGGIETVSRNGNAAGAIAVAADRLTIDGAGSGISSENLSQAGGDAGLVLVKSEALTLADGGGISTSSIAGAAGDIEIAMSETGLLRLEGRDAPGVITTSSGPGTGGRIIIAAPLAIVSNGGSILALGEQGGANVEIETRFFISSADRANRVAVDGSFLLEAQVGDVSSGTVERALDVIDASGVLRGQCAAVRETGQVSQLVLRPTGPYGRSDRDFGGGPGGMGSCR